MPFILAIDTSLGPCSVALFRDGALLGQSQEKEDGRQSEKLMQLIETLLVEHRLSYSELTHIACTVGPGGFTGIRTGLSAARGLALVLGIPVLGVNTLEAAAWPYRGRSQPMLVALNAYRGEAYVQCFQPDLTPESPPCSLPYDQLPALLRPDQLFLTNLDLAAEKHPAKPDAEAAGYLALDKLSRGLSLLPPDPLYIRAPDAKLPGS